MSAQHERYAQAVVDSLRGDFPDLEDATIAHVIMQAIARHHHRHDVTFEALLDERGNWRLKPAGRDGGRVRVACYRYRESDVDRQRANRLNAALEAIR